MKNESDFQIVDVRPTSRFNAEVPEPRTWVRSGNIPGSKNIPFLDLVNMETGELKPREELALIFAKAGIDTKRPTVLSCGSGVTACVGDLALKLLAADKISVYDGSWTEYVSI